MSDGLVSRKLFLAYLKWVRASVTEVILSKNRGMVQMLDPVFEAIWSRVEGSGLVCAMSPWPWARGWACYSSTLSQGMNVCFLLSLFCLFWIVTEAWKVLMSRWEDKGQCGVGAAPSDAWALSGSAETTVCLNSTCYPVPNIWVQIQSPGHTAGHYYSVRAWRTLIPQLCAHSEEGTLLKSSHVSG